MTVLMHEENGEIFLNKEDYDIWQKYSNCVRKTIKGLKVNLRFIEA